MFGYNTGHLSKIGFNYRENTQHFGMKKKTLDHLDAYDQKVEAFMAMLEAYSNEDLNRVPSNGGWTPLQCMHHLIAVEELGLKYAQKKLHHDPNPEKVGLKNKFRSVLLQLYLRLPFAFKAPPLVSGEALPHPSTLAETADRWRVVRQDWKNFLENLPDELSDKAVFKHPRAGRMGWVDLISFFQTHFERHREQAKRGLRG